MEFEDVKPGIWVRVTGNNDNLPGGYISHGWGFELGQIVKVKSYCEEMEWATFSKHPDWAFDFVLHPSQFEIVRHANGKFAGRQEKKKAPAKVKPGDIDLDFHRENLFQAVKDSGVGVCSWAWVYEDNTCKKFITNPCHASLNKQHTKKPVYLIYSLQYQLTDAEKKQVIPYLEWLANESPISHVFITKKGDEMFEKGIVLSCEVSIKMLYAVAVIIRRYFEYRASRETFRILVKEGADWNTVFWFMGFININPVNITNNSNAHNYLSGFNVGEKFKRKFRTWFDENFLKHPPISQTYKQHIYCDIYRNLCTGEQSFTSYFSNIQGVILKKDEWGVASIPTDNIAKIINHVKEWK